MEVYEFKKDLLERLEDCIKVFYWTDGGVPASKVRDEWANYLDAAIEPAGWQALWKIPRVICTELGLRYPTIVFGMVENVLFEDLHAIFKVQQVQDEDVHLPEVHEVVLEDLYPTIKQEYTSLNVQKTADFIDRLRFFYKNVWMPWDLEIDDDSNWVNKHLESRIHLYYDLRKPNVNRALAVHIRQLISEARYIQERREYLELDLNSEDDMPLEELDLTDDSQKFVVTELMRLNLRMVMIRSEVEILENEHFRKIFENIKYNEGSILYNSSQINADTLEEKQVSYIVTPPGSLDQQFKVLQAAKKYINETDVTHICPTLQDVLNVCHGTLKVFLAVGYHTMKFLEFSCGDGRFCGLPDKRKEYCMDDFEMNSKNDVIIASPEQESILFTFNSNFILENLVLDCKIVRTGISIKKGVVTLRNCRIIGDDQTSTQIGLICASEAELRLENCLIERFATGLRIREGARVIMEQVKFYKCKIAIDVYTSPNHTTLKMRENTSITNCRTGIYVRSIKLKNIRNKFIEVPGFEELTNNAEQMPEFKGMCLFKNCDKNILIENQTERLVEKLTYKKLYDSDDEEEIEASFADSDDVSDSLSVLFNNVM